MRPAEAVWHPIVASPPPGHVRARLRAPPAWPVHGMPAAQLPQRGRVRKGAGGSHLPRVQLQLQPLHQHCHAHRRLAAAPVLATCRGMCEGIIISLRRSGVLGNKSAVRNS